MIHVDETDPMGDVPPAFPYREVEIQRGVDAKQLYELSTELGRGKFGVVYKCKEKCTGVRLAAKFIQIVKKGDRRNIEREVHMMNVLHHAKIAQLYAAFEFDRTFCVMMELVEGGELFDRVLDEKFILTERACSIFMRQICDAVAYIHGNNIIHLDMKPENILCLTESGNRIKIIDFGLAREYDPDNKLQVLFGTPEFVAPEVVNFEAISFATDMWSVGVIAYVLVSGLSPFAGEDDIQTMGNITIGRYDFLDEAFDNVSEEAIDFINRCLVKEQKERLTAEDALKHKWIKRKPQYTPTNRRPSITTFKPVLLESNNNSSNVTSNEIDKDNLKELVGKWNETPNNRYTFEQDTENIISPAGDSVQLRRPTLPELAGLPNPGSRRGSIARDRSPHTTPATEPGLVEATSTIGDLETPQPAEAHEPAPCVEPSDGGGPRAKELDAATAAAEDADAMSSSPCTPLSPTSTTTIGSSSSSSASQQELDSELESLKSKVHTIRTSRAQNKLNELAQRPDFLANDPFKLPTFRFLPKSISLCNEDSVFKENYTKFCDRNASASGVEVETANTIATTATTTNSGSSNSSTPVKPPSVRKKSSGTGPTSGGTRKKKDSSATTVTTTTTFSSGGAGTICPSTTVRKTIVKQQKVLVDEVQEQNVTAASEPTGIRRAPLISQQKSVDGAVVGSSPASVFVSTASVKRTKFRVNQLSSRDVPVAINPVARRYLEQSGAQNAPIARLDDTDRHPTVVNGGRVGSRVKQRDTETTLDDSVTVNNLRNSALKLRSLSVDWDAVDAVENRSMKTINSFLKRHAVASSAVRQIQAQLEATITQK
ncbi:calcium/calmodulin-dependent protein kinase type II subunit beta isoform X2 [Anopheles aquasalis]|uniref:calcium/calmodulin-dependent protein kinase type II subunit beta isoform X2 n=1 Tax=Anopheles aquasalis TaxID=42839 RepID=UPI00215A4B19|nr:calcium/calmodulin-dependent protein kinase type II subunit beta isoform X2 [Anopheles aquasalis]